jgi:hypothetical protein
MQSVDIAAAAVVVVAHAKARQDGADYSTLGTQDVFRIRHVHERHGAAETVLVFNETRFNSSRRFIRSTENFFTTWTDFNAVDSYW